MGNKRVLITGGAGFIGSNLSRLLVRLGYVVIIYDNFSPQIHGENKTLPPDLQDKVKLIEADLKDVVTLCEALSETDILIHLAAETGTGQSMYEISKYFHVNDWGTSLICDFLVNKKHSIEKVIVASSRAIYGEGKYECENCGVVYPETRQKDNVKNENYNPVCPLCHSAQQMKSVLTDEGSKIHPNSFYGITKHVQEQMVLLTAKSIGIDGFALRFQNVYGPGQSLKNPYTGIISIFSSLARENKDIFIFEDGLESRDFVYIDDAVNAILQCMHTELNGQFKFNVGTGEKVTVFEVAQKIKQVLNSTSTISITGTFRMGDIRHNSADLNKISSLLNFKPKLSFNEGLNKFLAWVMEQNPVSIQDKYQNSLAEMKEKRLYF